MCIPFRIILRCSGVYETVGRSGESSGPAGLFCWFCPLVSFILRSRGGESSAAGLSLQVCEAASGADGRGDAGCPSARLSLRGSEPGRARQSLKKVIWNPSPLRMVSPPGILLANRKRECIAPPLGSTPLRHLSICL